MISFLSVLFLVNNPSPSRFSHQDRCTDNDGFTTRLHPMHNADGVCSTPTWLLLSELNFVELARGFPPPLLHSREVRRFSACPPPSAAAVAADFQHLRDQPSPSLTVMPRQTEGRRETPCHFLHTITSLTYMGMRIDGGISWREMFILPFKLLTAL